MIENKKASYNDFPQVLLFLDATTINGREHIFFQHDAFILGFPVHPITIWYPHVNFEDLWENIFIYV